MKISILKTETICFSPIFKLGAFLTLAMLAFAGFLRAESAPQAGLEGFIEAVRAMEFPVKDADKHAESVGKANGFIDLDSVGKKAMAVHWDKMTEAERQDFTNLFSKLIEAVAYRSSSSFFINAEVAYDTPVENESGASINARIRQKGEELDAEVLFHLSEIDGAWKIDDVVLDGVSIVEDLKYQFDKIIETSSYPGLIQAMQERLAKETVANQPGAA